MADSGFVFCSNGANVGTGVNWSGVDQIYADDVFDAAISLSSIETSKQLRAKDYDMSGLPASITIDGIEFQIVDYRETLNEIAWTISGPFLLNRADNTIGTTDPSTVPSSFWSGTDQTASVGDSTELWGETLARADVTDIDFGVNLKATNGGPSGGNGVLNAVREKVYYTLSDYVTGSGTADGATESQIITGGRTIILTLSGVEWLAIGSAFDASRQGIVDSIESGSGEALGWDGEISPNILVANVVRTSNTVVTITITATAAADYKITADEPLDISLGSTLHTGTTTLSDTAAITITAECDETLAPDTIATQTNLTGAVTDIDESVDSPDANWLVAA